MLEYQNITKKFGDFTALDNVSFEVPEGRIFGLLGPNGAGKTTLIRITNRITIPTGGRVIYNGRQMTDEMVRMIGYLPEERGLYKKMKVGEQMMYLARLKGLSKDEAVKALREWFVRFKIQSWWDKKVEELSKGMAQKVQFITTVIHRPPLLIFDEPFSGFDPVNADQLKREILRLRDEGAAILFSTHNMSSVEEVCQEITLINHSKAVLQGKVEEVRQRFKKNILEVTTADGQRFDYRLEPGQTMHDAIALLNDKYSLTGFREILPSMHEIFVETVNSNEVYE